MKKKAAFSLETLKLDCEKEFEKIAEATRNIIFGQFKKRGAVVAMSGGIDSSVVGAICTRALGKDRVLGLLLPEQDSSDDTLHLSRLIVDQLEIPSVHEDISKALDVLGCYRARDEAIKSVIPEYGPGYKCKIVLPGVTDSDKYRLFSLVVESPEGERTEKRLSPKAYLEIVAATNFKQRVRKMLEYYIMRTG